MCEAPPSTTSEDLEKGPPGIRRPGSQTFRRIDAPNQPARTEVDKEAVASLSATRIEHMQREELVRAIKAAHVPWIRAADEPHLAMYDIDALRRLVYLSRRICRNQGY